MAGGGIFSIPIGVPFLPALAAGVRERLPEPEALPRATILLPTRRAARALRTAFLPPGEGDAALLLPRLSALAGLSVEDAEELALPALLDLPPAVAPLTRQAVLAGFVQRWPPSRGGPVGPQQAWSLAGELAALFDEIALEETDLSLAARPAALQEAWLARLDGLVEGDLARHWQITTRFLRGVAEAWQGWLEEQGLLDIGTRRLAALIAQAEAWQAHPPRDMVVAAGIGLGGTIPAAARLLSVVAGLPQGFVVLHGEDPATATLPADALREAPTHPFHGQRRLLALMGEERLSFPPWTKTAPAPPRAALLGEALRPPGAIPAWQARRPEAWQGALAGLSLAAAADAGQEARAIALLLREALEQPGARAALVTPDRDLARRCVAELARYGIIAEDSAGIPLSLTPGGVFLRLLAAALAADFAPVPLLALLKHPLAAGGMAREEWLAAARRLERTALRGTRPEPGLAGLRRALPADADPACHRLLDALAAALGGLTALPEGPASPPGPLLESLLEAAEQLAARPDRPGGLALYEGEEGDALARHLAAMQEAFAHLPAMAPADLPPLLDAALAAGTLRRPRQRDAHPRVAVLGLIEARLLDFDRLILGGLDESVWPLATDPGPWMGRPMRARFGLPEPERRIGRVAADFLLLACAAPEVVLTRAARRGGAPTVPARWLTRLETFLRGQTSPAHPEGLALPASPAVAWAALLDQPPGGVASPAERPAPCPPPAARPRRLSVTEAETLLADPYAFYARRILRLLRLRPLDEPPSAADYGLIVHRVMAHFLTGLPPGALPADAAQRWQRAVEAALEEAGLSPALQRYWRARLARIGDFVLREEARLRREDPPAATHVELRGEAAFGDVILHGRADRVDLLARGGLLILDYKTGSLPTAKRVREGRVLQLPLEALLARRGGFPGLGGEQAERLVYWRLSGGQPPGEPMELSDIAQLTDQAEKLLGELIRRYLTGHAPFPARPHPDLEARGSDYDHLARLAEWAEEA
ncbi:MAG: double-strand break repair protein AddB [Rhodovarius sp.]|nr:double-strand break repair protein AddB [Rhodovarius sp.]